MSCAQACMQGDGEALWLRREACQAFPKQERVGGQHYLQVRDSRGIMIC